MVSGASRETLSLWRKFVSGANTRKTRLHDEHGRLAPLGRIIRNMPRAVFTGIARVTVGIRPARPWISYDAQEVLAHFLKPSSRVVEFGSGMSTLWYARRAAHIISIEDNRSWFESIRDQLSKQGNVDYRFVESRTDYVGCVPAETFDLIMIDGSWRDECARFAVNHLAAEGMIYLDNSDMGPGALTGDIPAARKLLLTYASELGLPVREFVDFAPTQFHVQRGLMIGGSL